MDAAIQGASAVGATQVNPSETTARAKRAESAAGIRATSPAASVDALPSSPPPEVLEQMAQAQRVYDKLASQGQSLHFDHDSAGRVTVALRDNEGKQIRELSLTEALALTSDESQE
ncbi:MAG TPA: hypothetical protein VMB05_05330 [Solirubrobacteraceae bacterium]|nr:hypothetical protein [Solirubrobacteraceae bacterium]